MQGDNKKNKERKKMNKNDFAEQIAREHIENKTVFILLGLPSNVVLQVFFSEALAEKALKFQNENAEYCGGYYSDWAVIKKEVTLE
jgi:hypothetical protein